MKAGVFFGNRPASDLSQKRISVMVVTAAGAVLPAGQPELGSDDQANERMAPTTTYPPPLAEPEHRRQRLKVGAVCGKAARPDLCGGREVTRVPTATRPTVRPASTIT
jgi:hypothetical protein